MEAKPVSKSSRKTKVYAGVILLFLACVFIRAGLVQRDRGRTIVSFVEEWSRKGKPVTVETITAKDVPVYTKLTVRSVSGKKVSGFVTGDIKEKLREGQGVFCPDKVTPCGVIDAIGGGLDPDTGMFPVDIELKSARSPGELAVFFVQTRTLTNALVVPNEVLDYSGADFFLWKVVDSKARKVKVTIASRDGYGVAIGEGVEPGDVIVHNGRSALADGDKVSIIKGAL
jgi:hypothetical protein